MSLSVNVIAVSRAAQVAAFRKVVAVGAVGQVQVEDPKTEVISEEAALRS